MTLPDLREPFAKAGLRVACPYCASVEYDDYEVLDAEEVHVIRCASCSGRFRLLLVECPECAEESAITWSGVPTPDDIRGARCSHCDARVYDDGKSLLAMGRKQ